MNIIKKISFFLLLEKLFQEENAVSKKSNNLSIKKICPSVILLPSVCCPFNIRLLSFCDLILLLTFLPPFLVFTTDLTFDRVILVV